MNNYDDIINIKNHEPKFHVRMSREQRAAQFAPFQALTGFENEVLEVSRTTSKKIELTDEEKEEINNILVNSINKYVCITYFEPDNKKNGGKYVVKDGIIRMIDSYDRKIIFKDKTKIDIDEILNIER